MPHLGRPLFALVTASFLLWPGTLFAQAEGPAAAAPAKPDEGGEARRAFQAGQQAFAEGRFMEAAHAFEEAYRIKPHASPLVNAGEAWERAEDPVAAARVYQRVLEMQDVAERDRSEAADRLTRLAQQLGAIALAGDAAVRVRVGEDEFHGGNRVYVMPGKHIVALVDVEGGGGTTELDIAANTEHTVDLDKLRQGATRPAEPPQPIVPDEKPEPAPDGAKIRPVTLIAYGVGAVGLAAFGYFGLRANSAADEFEAKFVRGEPNRDEYDRFSQSKLFANIGLGVGIAGVGVGTYFLWRDLKRPNQPEGEARNARAQRPLVIAVVPSARGAFVSTAGRF
jgi:hypothetical protein